ncbi:hemolysin A [Gracilibacillus halophilus YIM-C55.5]|uniref:Hemolysin A n=1 Tax=Gracilibacillus halophilus YIM-C55.5 TaxID=1308866 RepID=N4WDU9_9BACI|nr:TlyA family RNA methyltransferase [Gracilibacillus halophilus]ENH97424.1 hemolysin A [Gracilibacillus halophilus YIM-C55.5]
MGAKKIRIDQHIVEQGFVQSREKAKRTIMAGLVFVDGERVDKPGTKIPVDSDIDIKGQLIPYVGRGGLKLEKALKTFDLSLEGRKMIDIGASTGGFTDCGLQNGLQLSYAVDVGYNQLAWKLRNDDRVIVMERTNFRYMTSDQLSYGQPDFACIDVSFISLKLMLPPLFHLLHENGDIIMLVKPQFEAGREQVGKKGIVRDPNVHEQVLTEILTFAHNEGFTFYGLTFSPITGGDGNIEFLAWMKKEKDSEDVSFLEEVNRIVKEAHETLDQSKNESM